MRHKKEYGLTQKGLDAIDRIIKRSPQYKALIKRFIDDLHGHRGLRGLELISYIVSLEDKWEKEENE